MPEWKIPLNIPHFSPILNGPCVGNRKVHENSSVFSLNFTFNPVRNIPKCFLALQESGFCRVCGGLGINLTRFSWKLLLLLGNKISFSIGKMQKFPAMETFPEIYSKWQQFYCASLASAWCSMCSILTIHCSYSHDTPFCGTEIRKTSLPPKHQEWNPHDVESELAKRKGPITINQVIL